MADKPRAAIVNVRVTPQALKSLDARVKAEDSTRSEVVRTLIEGAGLPDGFVWVAFDAEGQVVPFASERDALRYAVKFQLNVIRVPFGIPLWAAVNAAEDQQKG